MVQKYALPDTLVLQRLSEFLMDNISNLTSPNKVSQLLTANETPTNHVTVGKYIKYLCLSLIHILSVSGNEITISEDSALARIDQGTFTLDLTYDLGEYMTFIGKTEIPNVGTYLYGFRLPIS